MKKIYVETTIHTTMEQLWTHSQSPDLHQRWDLRFQRIAYLPKATEDEPQRFCYATLGIDGVGVSIGERVRADGSATSALRFSSDHPLSGIVHGSGYWRYVPTEDGVRFLTGYDYEPAWRTPDRVFRPLMGWATAWSFDRLRLWLEFGITPEASLRHTLAEVAARAIGVVALGALNPWAGIVGVLLVIAIPPLPRTPAARRCLRSAPDRASAAAPGTLRGLTRP